MPPTIELIRKSSSTCYTSLFRQTSSVYGGYISSGEHMHARAHVCFICFTVIIDHLGLDPHVLSGSNVFICLKYTMRCFLYSLL